MTDSTPATAADLQRRIDRTVAYLRHLLDGPLHPTTRMVAEAAIDGLTRPAKGRWAQSA